MQCSSAAADIFARGAFFLPTFSKQRESRDKRRRKCARDKRKNKKQNDFSTLSRGSDAVVYISIDLRLFSLYLYVVVEYIYTNAIGREFFNQVQREFQSKGRKLSLKKREKEPSRRVLKNVRRNIRSNDIISIEMSSNKSSFSSSFKEEEEQDEEV